MPPLIPCDSRKDVQIRMEMSRIYYASYLHGLSRPRACIPLMRPFRLLIKIRVMTAKTATYLKFKKQTNGRGSKKKTAACNYVFWGFYRRWRKLKSPVSERIHVVIFHYVIFVSCSDVLFFFFPFFILGVSMRRCSSTSAMKKE